MTPKEEFKLNREEFIKQQFAKYPWIPSVDVGIPSWVRLGYAVDIYKGAVIGETGFGFTKVNGRNTLIPHVGGVSIGDYSVVLPGTVIARATAKDRFTILHKNVFLDALVHIAHNCVLGERTQMAAGVMLGGSCNIGKDVAIGLGATLQDHVTVADDVFIGSGAHVVKDCDKPNWIYADKVSASGMVYAHPIRERTEKDVL